MGKPLCDHNPTFSAFLVVFIIFGAFTIVSILTGVISEAMFEKSKARQYERHGEKERARTLFIRGARKIFQDHDEAGQGFLKQEQFNRCKDKVTSLSTRQYVSMQNKDLEAMFDLVDYAGSGRIEI